MLIDRLEVDDIIAVSIFRVDDEFFTRLIVYTRFERIEMICIGALVSDELPAAEDVICRRMSVNGDVIGLTENGRLCIVCVVAVAAVSRILPGSKRTVDQLIVCCVI